MITIRSTIVQHGKVIARRLAAQAAISGTVMLGFQLALGVSLLPTGDLPGTAADASPGLHESRPALAMTPAIVAQVEIAPLSKGDRLATPARLAALDIALMKHMEQVKTVDAGPPPARAVGGTRPRSNDTVLFENCLPLCESRDPLLVRVANISAADSGIAPVPATVAAPFDPLIVKDLADSERHGGIIQTLGSGLTAVGSGTVSAVVGTVRWLAASAPL